MLPSCWRKSFEVDEVLCLFQIGQGGLDLGFVLKDTYYNGWSLNLTRFFFLKGLLPACFLLRKEANQ